MDEHTRRQIVLVYTLNETKKLLITMMRSLYIIVFVDSYSISHSLQKHATLLIVKTFCFADVSDISSVDRIQQALNKSKFIENKAFIPNNSMQDERIKIDSTDAGRAEKTLNLLFTKLDGANERPTRILRPIRPATFQYLENQNPISNNDITNTLSENVQEISTGSITFYSEYNHLEVKDSIDTDNDKTSALQQYPPIFDMKNADVTGKTNFRQVAHTSTDTNDTQHNVKPFGQFEKINTIRKDFKDKENATINGTKNAPKGNEDDNSLPSLRMPQDLMSHVFSTTPTTKTPNMYALCGIWDFAGQRDFYATHQAFLTSSAIYLVVADMEDDICKQGKNQFFANFEHVGGISYISYHTFYI